ncbi:MAG: phosphotransferase [Elusimicrobia bacterium]|nr:phosphotransferase [Elusimicrobiota bacterium]
MARLPSLLALALLLGAPRTPAHAEDDAQPSAALEPQADFQDRVRTARDPAAFTALAAQLLQDPSSAAQLPPGFWKDRQNRTALQELWRALNSPDFPIKGPYTPEQERLLKALADDQQALAEEAADEAESGAELGADDPAQPSDEEAAQDDVTKEQAEAIGVKASETAASIPITQEAAAVVLAGVGNMGAFTAAAQTTALVPRVLPPKDFRDFSPAPAEPRLAPRDPPPGAGPAARLTGLVGDAAATVARGFSEATSLLARGTAVAVEAMGTLSALLSSFETPRQALERTRAEQSEAAGSFLDVLLKAQRLALARVPESYSQARDPLQVRIRSLEGLATAVGRGMPFPDALAALQKTDQGAYDLLTGLFSQADLLAAAREKLNLRLEDPEVRQQLDAARQALAKNPRTARIEEALQAYLDGQAPLSRLRAALGMSGFMGRLPAADGGLQAARAAYDEERARAGAGGAMNPRVVWDLAAALENARLPGVVNGRFIRDLHDRTRTDAEYRAELQVYLAGPRQDLDRALSALNSLRSKVPPSAEERELLDRLFGGRDAWGRYEQTDANINALRRRLGTIDDALARRRPEFAASSGAERRQFEAVFRAAGYTEFYDVSDIADQPAGPAGPPSWVNQRLLEAGAAWAQLQGGPNAAPDPSLMARLRYWQHLDSERLGQGWTMTPPEIAALGRSGQELKRHYDDAVRGSDVQRGMTLPPYFGRALLFSPEELQQDGPAREFFDVNKQIGTFADAQAWLAGMQPPPVRRADAAGLARIEALAELHRQDEAARVQAAYHEHLDKVAEKLLADIAPGEVLEVQAARKALDQALGGVGGRSDELAPLLAAGLTELHAANADAVRTARARLKTLLDDTEAKLTPAQLGFGPEFLAIQSETGPNGTSGYILTSSQGANRLRHFQSWDGAVHRFVLVKPPEHGFQKEEVLRNVTLIGAQDPSQGKGPVPGLREGGQFIIGEGVFAQTFTKRTADGALELKEGDSFKLGEGVHFRGSMILNAYMEPVPLNGTVHYSMFTGSPVKTMEVKNGVPMGVHFREGLRLAEIKGESPEAKARRADLDRLYPGLSVRLLDAKRTERLLVGDQVFLAPDAKGQVRVLPLAELAADFDFQAEHVNFLAGKFNELANAAAANRVASPLVNGWQGMRDWAYLGADFDDLRLSGNASAEKINDLMRRVEKGEFKALPGDPAWTRANKAEAFKGAYNDALAALNAAGQANNEFIMRRNNNRRSAQTIMGGIAAMPAGPAAPLVTPFTSAIVTLGSGGSLKEAGHDALVNTVATLLFVKVAPAATGALKPLGATLSRMGGGALGGSVTSVGATAVSKAYHGELIAPLEVLQAAGDPWAVGLGGVGGLIFPGEAAPGKVELTLAQQAALQSGVGRPPAPWFGGRLAVPFALLQNFNVFALGRPFGYVPGAKGVIGSYGKGALILEKPYLGGSTLQAHLVSPVTPRGARGYARNVHRGVREVMDAAPRLRKQGYKSIEVEAHSQKVLEFAQKHGFEPVPGAKSGFSVNFWLIEKFGLLPAGDVVLNQPVRLRLNLEGPAPAGSPPKSAPPPASAGSRESGSTRVDGQQLAGRQAAVKRSMKELAADLFGQRADAANAVADPLAPVRRLDDIGNLPPEPKARQQLLAKFVKEYMGLDGILEVSSPATEPLSGAQVFLIRQGGEIVAVAKVLGAKSLIKELGAGEAVGRLGLQRSKVVEARGAFRAGAEETLFIMEAAPGRDLYSALREVGKSVGETRGRALKEAKADVEAVAEAMGELHRASRSPEVSKKTRAYDVGSAEEMLAGLRERLPADLYQELKAQLDRLAPMVRDGTGPGAVTHGDAHPGNFFVRDGRVTLIDIETVMHSLGNKEAGVGNPAADVGRFLETLRLNNRARGLMLQPAELVALERAFTTAYAREAGFKMETLQSGVEFYRLRMTLAAMKNDPVNIGHYSDSARGLLKELGSR